MASKKLTLRSIAVLSAASLMLAACGGGDDNDSGSNDSGSSSSDGGSSEGGMISIQGSEPEKGLIPGDTTESGGSQFVNAMWTGLVTYNPEDGAQEMNGVAESIEPIDGDNSKWEIKLKDGWTFHDGTPVDAESFVKAWNLTARSDSGFGGSYFMGNIVGYDDVQAETDDEGNETAPAKSEDMSGLKVVDDKTFTVELTSPFSAFPVTLGYNAFFPLPKAYYDDPEGFGKKPIGNGPWMAETELTSTDMVMKKFEDYKGEDKPKADKLKVVLYTDLRTPYLDVKSNGLDVASVPPDAIENAPTDFGDRYYERASSSFAYLGFPTYDERFSDKRVRQGLSMAIDRKAIVDSVFAGTREAAFDAVAPVVEGYREDACEYCKYDPEAAKKKLEEANFDMSKPVEIWFNAGAGHEDWTQAVGNMWKNIGLDYKLKGDLQFAQYLPKIDEKGMTGPFRLGWVMDYPSMQNYLEPLYSSAALPPKGSNGTFYVNPEFDAKIKEGNEAASVAESVKSYQAADDILLEDMPIMPVFFGKIMQVHSENVDNLAVDPFGNIITTDLEVVK